MSRILIIDDDASFRRAIRHALESEGHEVLDAESGEAGLELFRTERPDLVVTDIYMPGLGGLQTIEAIRMESPETKIIAVSGNGGIAAATMLPTGRRADRSLVKPFKRTDLLESVDQLLPQASPRTDN